MLEGKEEGDIVKSSTPIGKAISDGAGLYANDIMNARDSMEIEYGKVVKELNLSLATFGKSSTLGAYDGSTVYLANKYASNNNLTDVMKQSAESGYHPKLGNKTGAEAVASHEIGHHLGRVAARKAGITEREIVHNAAKRVGIKGNYMAAKISEYARTSYSETVAEAFSDVYCNGKKANKCSIAIVGEIKQILK